MPYHCKCGFQSLQVLENYYCSSSARDKLVWTCNELSELITYLQYMPLELELECMWVNLWRSNANLNTRVKWLNTLVEWLNTQVLIEFTRKVGIHSWFGDRQHEVRNELYCMCLKNQLGVSFNVCMLPKWDSRHTSWSTFAEYSPIFTLSVIQVAPFLPLPLLVTLSPTFFVQILQQCHFEIVTWHEQWHTCIQLRK